PNRSTMTSSRPNSTFRWPFTATIAALLLVLWTGCDSVNDEEGKSAGSVFIANQGNFSDGNGSVSRYEPETQSATPAAITGLGSIVQSASVVQNRLYVMSNSANRIDVFDALTLEQIAQIDSVVSPRYLVAGGNIAYVTGLFGGFDQFDGGLVTVIDLAANAKLGEIQVGDNPEGMALVGQRLFVANHGFGAGRTVSVIDTETRAVVQTIDADCDGPRFLAADAEAEVVVFCTGSSPFEGDPTSGAVRVIDASTGDILKRVAVDGQIATAGFGQDVAYDAEAERAYAVRDERVILVFDTASNELVGTIGPLEDAPISAIAVDQTSGRIYLGRFNEFTAAGEVSIHLDDGVEVDRFAAGIVPTYIDFGR